MMYEIIQPKEKISKKAIRVWRLTNTITYLVLIIGSIILLWLSYFFDWAGWITIIFWLAVVFFPLFSIWAIFFRPYIYYRFWRYGMDEYYLRLRYGIFTRTDVVIPMTKIQYVEANQGPIMRRYNLYSITVGTLGSTHEIPAIKEEEAFTLRDQISEHARLKEVE